MYSSILLLLTTIHIFGADFYVSNTGSGTSCSSGTPCNINNVPYADESRVLIASSGSNYTLNGLSVADQKYQYVGIVGPASTFIRPTAQASGNVFEISGSGSVDFDNVTLYCTGCDTSGCVGFSKFLVWMSGGGSCGCLNSKIVQTGDISYVVFGASKGTFTFKSSTYSGDFPSGYGGLFQLNSTNVASTQSVVMENSVFENISFTAISTASVIAGMYGNTAIYNNILSWSFTDCLFNNITVGESSAVASLIMFPNYNSNSVLDIIDSNFTAIIHNGTGLISGAVNERQSYGNITNGRFVGVTGQSKTNGLIIIRSDWGHWYVFDTLFENCTTGGNSQGGMIYTQWVWIVVQNSIFRSNVVANYGGAIHITGDNVAERRLIIYCVFENNTAKRGGAIYSSRSFTVSNCFFNDNVVTDGATYGMDIYYTYNNVNEGIMNSVCTTGSVNRYSHNGNDLTYLIQSCACTARSPGTTDFPCQVPMDTITCVDDGGSCVEQCSPACGNGLECTNSVCTPRKCDDLNTGNCNVNTTCEMQNGACKRKCNPTCESNYNCVDGECVVKSCSELAATVCTFNQNCYLNGGSCTTCASGAGCGFGLMCNTAGSCVESPCESRNATDTETFYTAIHGSDESSCGSALVPCRHVMYAANLAMQKTTSRVLAEPGQYEETDRLQVTRDLVVKGASQADCKLSKGNCNQVLFSINSAGVSFTITKFTLLTRNCGWNTGFLFSTYENVWIKLILCRITPPTPGGSMGEGFIYVENNAVNVLLESCAFFGITSTAGKPFISSDRIGTFFVNSSTFVNVRSTATGTGGYGPCFSLLNAGNCTLLNSRFIYCRSTDHVGVGHVQLRGSGIVVLDSCEFYNVSSALGALSVTSSGTGQQMTVQNCTHVDVTANTNGAAYKLSPVLSCVFTTSTFVRCTSTSTSQDGGVINAVGSSLAIENCLFLNSSAFRGGVLNLDGSNATITNSVFRGSVATGGEGGSEIVTSGNAGTLQISNSFSNAPSPILNAAGTAISGTLAAGAITCTPGSPTNGACDPPCVTNTGSSACSQGDGCPAGYLPSHGKCVPQCSYTLAEDGVECPVLCPPDSSLGIDMCSSLPLVLLEKETSICGSLGGNNCFFFPRASETGTEKCGQTCDKPAFVGDLDETTCFFVRCQERTPLNTTTTFKCGLNTEVPRCFYDPSAQECTTACSTNNNHLTGSDSNNDGICDVTSCNVRLEAGEEGDGRVWKCGFPDESPPCNQNLGRDTENSLQTVCATSCSDSLHYAADPAVNDGVCQYQDCTTRMYTDSTKCGLNCIYDSTEPADHPCVAECNKVGLHSGESDGVCVLLDCEQRTFNKSSLFPCGPDFAGTPCLWDPLSSNVGKCARTCSNSLYSPTSYRKCDLPCDDRVGDTSITYPCGNDGCFHNPATDNGCSSTCSFTELFDADPVTGRCVLKECSERRPSEYLQTAPCGTKDCYRDVGSDSNRCVLNCSNTYWYEKGPNGECITKPNCGGNDPTYDPGVGDDGVRVGEMWVDTEGKPVQAHGGDFLQKDGKYYWVGENHAFCGTDFIHLALYTSDDLIHWEFRKDLITWWTRWQNDNDKLICDIGGKRFDYCTVERPAFMYNELTHRYVIWAHFEENGEYEWWNESEAQHILVAQSSADDPESEYFVVSNSRPGVGHVAVDCIGDPTYVPGNYMDGGTDPLTPGVPFIDGSLVNESVTCVDAWGGPRPHPYPWGYSSRDFTVFEDPDTKEAYLVSDMGNTLRVYTMNNDYLGLDWQNSYPLNIGRSLESPALAKKDGVFFLITTHKRGYLPTQARYQTTRNLRKPLSAAAAAALGIEWDGNTDTWGSVAWSDLKYVGSSTTFNSEPAEIITLMDTTDPLRPVEQFLYLGDRWNTTDLSKSAYVWLPLTLDSTAETARLDFTTEWTVTPKGRLVKNELQNLSSGKTCTGTNLVVGTCPYNVGACGPEGALDGNWNIYDDSVQNSFFRGVDFPYAWTVDLGELYSVQRIDLQFFVMSGSETSTRALVYGAPTGNDWVALVDSDTQPTYGFGSWKVSGYFRYIKVDVLGNTGWGADWESGLLEVGVWGMPQSCTQRTKVDYNETHPCGPDIGSAICYWDPESTTPGKCSSSCANLDKYDKVDSRRSCLVKCNQRVPDPDLKYPCGNDGCYEDPNAEGSEGRKVCTPSCSIGTIFVGDDKTGKCVLRNCTNRTSTEQMPSAPCGTLDCYADIGFNDSKCAADCTNSGMFEKGNAGACVPKPNCIEDDPTYDGSKGDDGIRNGETWLDTRGKPIQAHGGDFLQRNGKYYWIGENRAHCNTEFIHVGLYVSDDLIKWEYKKDVLNSATKWKNDNTKKICDLNGNSYNCLLFRPALLYNEQTNRYVIYAHWEENGVYEWWNESEAEHILIAQSSDDDPESEFFVVFNGRPGVGHVAVACVGDPTYNPSDFQAGASDPATPGVPYISGSFTNESVTCVDAWGGPRPHPYPWGYSSKDFAVFEDPDSGEAYLVSDQGSTMRVYILNSDYLGLDWQNSYPLNAGQWLESPALAKKDGVFFLISSHQQGWKLTQTRYQTTANLRLPTSNSGKHAQANAVEWDGDPDHWGDATWSELKYFASATAYNSEPSEIVTIMDTTDPDSPVEQFVYLGDRWNETDLGKSTYVWLPLTLDSTNQIATLDYTTEWTVTPRGKIVKNELELLTKEKTCSGTELVVGNCPHDLGNCGCEGALNGIWNIFSDNSQNSFFRAVGYPWSWIVDLNDIYSVQRIDIQYFVLEGSEVSVYGTVYGSTDRQNWVDIANSRTQPQYGFVSYKVGGYYRYISINVSNNTGYNADWESGLVEAAVYGMPQTCSQRTKVDYNETFPCGPDVGSAGCYWDPESSNSGRCATECADSSRYDLVVEKHSCLMKCLFRQPDPLLRYPCGSNTNCMQTSVNTCTSDCTSDGFGYCLPGGDNGDSGPSQNKVKIGTIIAIIVVVVVVVVLVAVAVIVAYVIIRKRRNPIGKKTSNTIELYDTSTKTAPRGTRNPEEDVLGGANHTLYDGNTDEVSIDENIDNKNQPVYEGDVQRRGSSNRVELNDAQDVEEEVE